MNEKEGFRCNFEALETFWKGTAKDITKVAVDKDDPYFASLLAACIISHVGGISRKHLVGSEGIPKVVVSEVLHLLPHEKVFGRSQEDGLLHHGRDERTRQGQPADENPVEKEVRENPGEHKFVVPTASEQVEHKELPLRDDEEQYGRHGDRIRRGGPRDEQERRRLNDSHQGRQRRSHQDGAKTFPTRRGVLRLLCVGCAGTNQVAHRRTGSKEFADPGYFPQTRKRHHYPGRSHESHLGHEVGDKKHERGFEPRHLTGNNPNPLRHNNLEGKGRGV